MSNQDNGDMAQSDELVSSAPQSLEIAPVQVSVPVERAAPVPPPAEELASVPDLPANMELSPEAAVAADAAIYQAPVEQEQVAADLDVMPEDHDGRTDPIEVPAPVQEPAVAAAVEPSPAAPVEEPAALADAEMAAIDQSEFSFPPPEPVGNATQERPCTSPLPKGWTDPTEVWMPADTTSRVTDYLTSQPRTDLTDTEAGAEWIFGITEGAEHGIHRDFAGEMAQRPDANWRQRVEFGTNKLEIASPKFGDDGPILSGERGVLRMNALLGRGSIVAVPMWHSGFWITFKLPGEEQLNEMEERIASDKMLLGRQTHGLVFSNTSVYIQNALVDLCMDCIYETTIKDVKTVTEVRNLLKEPDLHMLAWGLACVIYPRGFQYLRSMLDEKGQRTEVIREKLNVATLLWVDDAALTDWQRSHMSNRQAASMEVKNIQLYQDIFTKGKEESVRIGDNLAVTFKTPMLHEGLAQGFLWVDDTARAIARSLTDETTVQRRNELMMKQGKATSMRQYVHWVQSIDLPDSGHQITDRATIYSAFNSLSADDKIREAFYKAMQTYIAKSTVAMIATPLINEKEKEFTKPNFPWLLPIDPVSVFITLLSQKAQQISTRP